MQVEIKDIPINHLQKLLIKNQQIITYFRDIEKNDKAFQAVQFWGTKGFFNSYYAKTVDPLNTEDLTLWIKKFNELFNVHKNEGLKEEKETVSISTFSNLIHQLGTDYDLWNSGDSYESSLNQFELGPDKWLYNSREHSSPVLRGEACLALYNLFFAIYNHQ